MLVMMSEVVATASSLAGTELRPGEEAMGAARVSSHAKQEKYRRLKLSFLLSFSKRTHPVLSPHSFQPLLHPRLGLSNHLPDLRW